MRQIQERDRHRQYRRSRKREITTRERGDTCERHMVRVEDDSRCAMNSKVPLANRLSSVKK